MDTTYLRFVIGETDIRTGKETGLFTAAYAAIRSSNLFDYEERELRKALDWLERNLPVPKRFSRKRNAAHKNTPGVAWIKPTATEAIEQIRRLVSVLESHGIQIRVLKTSRPGYVVYEDEFQVVAEPFQREKS